MIPKRKRPPRLSDGASMVPKRGERGSPVSAAGASVSPKRRRHPCLSGKGLGGPKAKERRRHPCLSGKGLGGPKAKEAPSPEWRGPR